MTDRSELLRIEVVASSLDSFVVVVAGEVDLGTAAQLEERLRALGATAGVGVVVDLAAVTFIDSSGIHALLSCARSIEDAGGSLLLAAPSPTVRRLFELVNIGEVIPVEAERTVAIARLRADPGCRGGDA